MDKKSMLAAIAAVGVTGTPVTQGIRGDNPSIVIIDDHIPHGEILKQLLDHQLGKHKDTITNAVATGNMLNMGYKNGEIVIDSIPPEDYYLNTDSSELENRVMNNMRGYSKQEMQDSYLNMSHPGYIPLFHGYPYDTSYIDNYFYRDEPSFPTPPRKWERMRSKYHELRSAFLAKAKRKRNLNKANRKRARNA